MPIDSFPRNKYQRVEVMILTKHIKANITDEKPDHYRNNHGDMKYFTKRNYHT